MLHFDPEIVAADFAAKARLQRGPAWTMQKVYVRKIVFSHNGQVLKMQRRMPAGLYDGGFIYGLLLQARDEGIDQVDLDVDFERQTDLPFIK